MISAVYICMSLPTVEFDTSGICHVLVYCFGSFLLQDMFLNLQVFAFEGQDMTFTVNVFLFLAFYIVTPVPAVLELFASTVGRFLLRVSYVPSYISLRRRRSFTLRKLYACLEKFLYFELSEISM